MLFPPDRKLARSKGLWPRLVAAVGLAAFSCTFPDYRFDPVPPETCSNDVLDPGETGVDCGGDCDPCPCREDDDCLEAEEICDAGVCRDPCDGGECSSCTDNKQNGDETDTDCGGSCDKCDVGDECEVDDDCETKVCDETCQAASCDDKVQNGSETSKDCGGSCSGCPNGQACKGSRDCESNTCVEGKCVEPLCSNGEVDGGETDEDCGGNTQCQRCDVGQKCNKGSDCVEKVCDDARCALADCDDTVKNGVETDVDCGGPGTCPRCDDGEDCSEDSDCKNKICNEDNECQPADCDDGVLNGDESDLDCGGSCPGCSLTDSCYEDGDCESMICDRSTDAPIGECVSCSDGKRNGSELGLDCGGSDCELCQPGAPCIDDRGCVNYLCNDDQRCDVGLSLDYRCGQCGETTEDHIKFFVTLHNLSDAAIDVRDVTLRYYFDADLDDATLQRFTLECEYEGAAICGAQSLKAYPNPVTEATHYFETIIGVTDKIEVGGSAALELTMRIPSAQPLIKLDQDDDYSFVRSETTVTRHPKITLHRRGTLIWGDEP